VRELPEDLEIVLTKRVGLLAACFPQVAVGEQTLKVYVQMLADIPLDVLDAVIEQAVTECKFFPSLAELRRVYLALTSDLTHRPASFEAWGAVLAEFGRTGSYGEPQFADPLVARCVEIVGWRQLCLSENQVADRAHFVRVYEQLQRRAEDDLRWLPASRAMIERAVAAKRIEELPAPTTSRLAGEVVPVPPPPEFFEALRQLAEAHSMPERDEDELYSATAA
jgi:hypothetical protein